MVSKELMLAILVFLKNHAELEHTDDIAAALFVRCVEEGAGI